MKKFIGTVLFVCWLIPSGNNVFARQLHVPSPDWQDQIIYFIMIDRFADGDTSNNAIGPNEYDPSSNAHYSGGDLYGIIDKLDYIQGLGATAIWITPPVANQWWDPTHNFGGYHGYWAENFMKVDQHYGTLAAYKALSDSLHRRGMYLIQDIVCNHMGNFHYYDGPYDPENPAQNFKLNTEGPPVPRPTQSPFDLNDYNNPEHRKRSIYHWTPAISDFHQKNQKLNYQLADLDDLNTENPEVIEALKESYNYWIKEVGVDGYRIDTVIYCDHPFWNRFIHDSTGHPGIERFAKSLNKKAFMTFGEAWADSPPFEDAGEREIVRFEGSKSKPEMRSMINFPLQRTMQSVFGKGGGTDEMRYRIEKQMSTYSHPHEIVNFVDNHDMTRFLASASEAALRQALFLIFTVPGMPTVYYGTEQGFGISRQAMFANGFASGGIDHFNQESKLYKFIAGLSNLRSKSPALRRGMPRFLSSTKALPGVLAWTMSHADEQFLLVLNSNDATMLADFTDPELADQQLELELSLLPTVDSTLQIPADGRFVRSLAGRSAAAWRVSGAGKSMSAVKESMLPQIAKMEKNLKVSGSGKPESMIHLSVDGNLDHAMAIKTDFRGNWQQQLDRMKFTAGEHYLVAVDDNSPDKTPATSDRLTFTVTHNDSLLIDYADQAGDDHGPEGKYLYPTSIGFENAADLASVRIYQSGPKLRFELQMQKSLVKMWSPPHGFDHVGFMIYADAPGLQGKQVMPFQNANVPAGMDWDYLIAIGGYASALVSSEGASASAPGTPLTPAPVVTANHKTSTIMAQLQGSVLDQSSNFAGWKFYITVWDLGGGDNPLRPLRKVAEGYSFGGGDPGDPLIMDDSVVLTVPK